MANLTPTSSFVYPNFDQGLGRRKKGVDFQGDDYVLGTLGMCVLFNVASIAANAANTTVQAYFPLAGRVKIPKIAVFLSALNALTGHSFNIVVGTGSYSQGSVAGNDNSSVPPVAYNAGGQPTGGTSPAYAAGGGGIATNEAVAGNALFAADVVFNATNFPNISTGTGTGSTSQILVPSSPDAVYGNGSLLTLRVTTPASTGSISNLVIAAYIEPQPLSTSYPSTQNPGAYIPVPNVDF